MMHLIRLYFFGCQPVNVILQCLRVMRIEVRLNGLPSHDENVSFSFDLQNCKIKICKCLRGMKSNKTYIVSLNHFMGHSKCPADNLDAVLL